MKGLSENIAPCKIIKINLLKKKGKYTYSYKYKMKQFAKYGNHLEF